MMWGSARSGVAPEGVARPSTSGQAPAAPQAKPSAIAETTVVEAASAEPAPGTERESPTTSSEPYRQLRDPETGRFVADPNKAPSGTLRRLRPDALVRKEVELAAPRDELGRFLDPNTFEPIEGKYDLGHKTGKEFRRLKADAERRRLSQEEFNQEQQDAELYQIEDPSSNRSRKFEDPRPVQQEKTEVETKVMEPIKGAPGGGEEQ